MQLVYNLVVVILSNALSSLVLVRRPGLLVLRKHSSAVRRTFGSRTDWADSCARLTPLIAWQLCTFRDKRRSVALRPDAQWVRRTVEQQHFGVRGVEAANQWVRRRQRAQPPRKCHLLRRAQ
jgi:hypothetical protein